MKHNTKARNARKGVGETPLRILSVRPRGLAALHGVKPGEELVKINGETLIDDIDYQALTARSRVVLTVNNAEGDARNVTIIKAKEAPLGLTLDETLAPRVCKNKCAFCFIDQMPKGMRPTLYVKDDDWRLSLLMGNFVTLTNVDEAEFERIIRRKASPLYISVHTTDPELRVRLMRNPNAGQIMARLTRLKDAGLSFHCQIVLCPGWNDGDALDRTLSDLTALYPAARSAALVPVGLTKCREGLEKLTTYDRAGAQRVIAQAERWQNKMLGAYGTRFVFPADEFYCQAGEQLPEEDAYEGFPQIENGVGLLRKFEESLKERALRGRTLSETAGASRKVIACGASIADNMRRWVREYAPKGASVTVLPVTNGFFGATVTVSGLLTGGDIVRAVAPLAVDEVLISATTLRADGDLFLDDMSLDDARKALGDKKLTVVQNVGAALYEALL